MVRREEKVRTSLDVRYVEILYPEGTEKARIIFVLEALFSSLPWSDRCLSAACIYVILHFSVNQRPSSSPPCGHSRPAIESEG
jgi:hypothetical protein